MLECSRKMYKYAGGKMKYIENEEIVGESIINPMIWMRMPSTALSEKAQDSKTEIR